MRRGFETACEGVSKRLAPSPTRGLTHPPRPCLDRGTTRHRPERPPLPDPFRHHPELRGKIRPAAQSFFRDLDLAALDARVIAAGQPADWRTPDAVREANRRAWLADHRGHDLWVFAYGSLMWDPALDFSEVRHGTTEGFERNFCLRDDGARGSVEHPGLMAAIDGGGMCAGLVFRIEADKVEHETFVLFRREMIADGYIPVWLDVDTAHGPVRALSFAANRACDNIVPGLPLEEQARMIAHAEGDLGSNFEYLDNLRAQLALLGIEDAYVTALYARVTALRAREGAQE